MFKKNDVVTLTITGMTTEGNGVGRCDGIAVFVAMSAIGDTLKVRITKVQKTFAYGIIDEILTPSPNRINCDCSVFTKCGGCAFRHISYESELAIKEDFVYDAFKRIGRLDVPFEKVLGCTEENHYRNKAQYPVAEIDGNVVCGFYSRRSHRVVPFTECKLQPLVFEKIANAIINLANENKIPAYNEETCTGILRHIYIREGYHSKEIMVCFVVNKPCKDKLLMICDKLTAEFSAIKSIVMNINSKNTNVILGNKNVTLYGSDEIMDTMCENKINLSPLSFYQVNTAQAELLYGVVSEYAELTGSEEVMDLYCGAGTIGLSLANKAKKILGVEIIEQAVENAISNANSNGIVNAEFICGDASKVATDLAQNGNTPDIIVVDPPRKGCDEDALQAILTMSPKQVIMVSCNPATAARDCAFLCKNGYKVVKGRAVDLFPRTTHVETVVLLSKLQAKQHIEVELKTDELDLTSVESKATYDEIKACVKEHSGLSVSSLYIAQVKEKCGIIERENYNKVKSEDAKQPKCPKEKEAAIMDALKYYKMI